jgi:dimethylamine/trimethylamine dehydrogenase
MGGVLAELLVKHGRKVTLVTPSALASSYTRASLEQSRIQSRLIELGVTILANQACTRIAVDHVVTGCVFSGREQKLEAGAVVLVTMRLPVDDLARDLSRHNLPFTIIGDAWAPATIAHAVHAGRRYAEDLGLPIPDIAELPYRREVMALSIA